MTAGRKMLEGVVRYASGQINKSETEKRLAAERKANGDAGEVSPKVKAARDYWNAKCFKGGGQANHAGDAIGLLWLLGKLDTPGVDETRLLDAARAWWHGREVTFKPLGHKTAKYERASRTSAATTKDSKAEREYQKYESFLLDASGDERDHLHELMTVDLDGMFPEWVSRIIQTEALRHIRLPFVFVACDADYANFAAAKRALMAMAGAEALRKAA